VTAARELSRRGPFGLFGTSIAGTWLCDELGDGVSFFVDEDPHRAGKRHMGRPIHDPARAPGEADVFLALPPGLAEVVASRLERTGAPFRCHRPAPLTGDLA
jgi:hypothetical protein